MLPYILVFVLIFACSFLDLIRIRKSALFIGLVILLWLFVGTRLVGPDLFTYFSFFKIIPGLGYLLPAIPKFTVLTAFEPGYLLLNGIFHSFHLDFFSFMLFYCAVFLFFFTHNLKYYTDLPFTALLIFTGFIYMSSFSAIRQIMAAAIFFYSLRSLIDGHGGKYLLWILLASLFHVSAIPLMIFYFVRDRKLKNQTIIVILGALMILMFTGFFASVANQFIKLIPFFPAKMQMYLNDQVPFWGSVSIFWIVILIICFFFRQQLESVDKNFNLFFNILWIGFAIYIVATGFGGFGRILLFFKLAFVVILPLFVTLTKGFYSKTLIIFSLGIIAALLFFSAILTDTRYFPVNRYLPYKTWLLNDRSEIK